MVLFKWSPVSSTAKLDSFSAFNMSEYSLWGAQMFLVCPHKRCLLDRPRGKNRKPQNQANLMAKRYCSHVKLSDLDLILFHQNHLGLVRATWKHGLWNVHDFSGWMRIKPSCWNHIFLRRRRPIRFQKSTQHLTSPTVDCSGISCSVFEEKRPDYTALKVYASC